MIEEALNMIVTAQYDAEATAFISDIDAEEIAEAFKSGKNVMVHFVKDEPHNFFNDMYSRMICYEEGYVDDGQTYAPNFTFASPEYDITGDSNDPDPIAANIWNVSNTYVDNNKLCFYAQFEDVLM